LFTEDTEKTPLITRFPPASCYFFPLSYVQIFSSAPRSQHSVYVLPLRRETKLCPLQNCDYHTNYALKTVNLRKRIICPSTFWNSRLFVSHLYFK
jgi:hypothetical protein